MKKILIISLVLIGLLAAGLSIAFLFNRSYLIRYYCDKTSWNKSDCPAGAACITGWQDYPKYLDCLDNFNVSN